MKQVGRITYPTQLDEMEDGSIDAGLHILASITPRGVTRSYMEIAEACGCSDKNISLYYYNAIKKLREAFPRMYPEVLRELDFAEIRLQFPKPLKRGELTEAELIHIICNYEIVEFNPHPEPVE